MTDYFNKFVVSSMERLKLLFAKDCLQYQIVKNKSVLDENSFFVNQEQQGFSLLEKLEEVLAKQNFKEIEVLSAINHFTIVPDGFSDHDLGYDLLSFNSEVSRQEEELMLSINKKFGIQFYYSLPKNFYHKIKNQDAETSFNFSGEKFLNSINNKHKKEIHINLYHNQCEFLAISDGQLVLYNNLDVNSEVDFLYFIMFTLNKIGFGTKDTYFFVYGETTENETFISELRKFVKHLKIVFDNLPKKIFILN